MDSLFTEITDSKASSVVGGIGVEFLIVGFAGLPNRQQQRY